MVYIPYHDGTDPCLQEIPARRARSGVVVIGGQCDVGKKLSNWLGVIALGTAWEFCGKVLRRFHQSYNDEAYQSQVNNGSEPPASFVYLFCNA